MRRFLAYMHPWPLTAAPFVGAWGGYWMGHAHMNGGIGWTWLWPVGLAICVGLGVLCARAHWGLHFDRLREEVDRGR